MLIPVTELAPADTLPRVGMAWLGGEPASRDLLAETAAYLLGGSSSEAQAALREAMRAALAAGADPEAVVAEAADWPLAFRAAHDRPRRARWIMARLRLSRRAAARVLACVDPEAAAWALTRCGGWPMAIGQVVDADADPVEGTLYRVADSLRVRGAEIVRALVVRCPSTGREHVLLVPAACRTAREARRWTMHGLSPEVEA